MAPSTTPSERSPLLQATATSEQDGRDNAAGNGIANGHATSASSDVDKPKPSIFKRLFGSSQILAILLSGTVLSFTFSITQTPMLYAFHLIECDIYYETHPPYEGTGDKCSVDWVAAQMAIQMSIVGMCTTFFGTFNLFVAGWSVKRWGPRFALILQLVFSGTRVAIQTIGIYIGGQTGIITIACSQMVTVLGGPAGYILILNTIAGELVEPMRRTAVFGQLQGSAMIGTASGFLLGGLIGNSFGIRMPFQTAFCMFCVSAIYVRLVLPYISPDSMSGGKKRGSGKKGFLAPLRLLAPQRIRMPGSAVTRKHYGVVFLCLGIFTSVLATAYVPILVQMYATVAFDFNQTDNGILMSGNFAVRAFFLIFIFPRIIDAGRAWWSSSKNKTPKDAKKQDGGGPTAPAHLPIEPEDFDRPAGLQGEEEPEILQPADEEDRSACQFDLFFLRWSLLLDGFLTTVAAYGTQPWHMFLAAYLLPFGSGSAPAAKGVITEMIPESQRTDALSAITLVENIARLSTVGLFGFVFSAFAEVGKAYLSFFCNAAIAIVGMIILLFSHFPPPGSEVVEDTAESDHGTEQPHPDSEREPLRPAQRSPS